MKPDDELRELRREQAIWVAHRTKYLSDMTKMRADIDKLMRQLELAEGRERSLMFEVALYQSPLSPLVN